MRSFIAVEIPEVVRETIADIQNTLKLGNLDAKWVAPHNLHLTLKFLGDTQESLREKLEVQLCKAAAQHKRFPMSLSGLGVFPGVRCPKVIWAGITQGEEPLKSLVCSLERECEILGFPREKHEFKAHLTIARLRSATGTPYLVNELERQKGVLIGDLPVNDILLIQSILHREGPEYIVRERFNLRR